MKETLILMGSEVKTTRRSFEYQWRHLNKGASLLTDAQFRRNCRKYILEELGVEKIEGLVFDMGCGNGRWSYAFLTHGCEVVAMDYTVSGCRATRENTLEFKDSVEVLVGDVFHPPFRPNTADILFAFGILHHTGDTKRAFEKLAPLVEEGGLYHVYLYAREDEPPSGQRFTLSRLYDQLLSSSIKLLFRIFRPNPRWQHRILSLLYKESKLHGAFDLLSPKIADRNLTEEEVEAWFQENSFIRIRRIFPDWCSWDRSDLHMNGVRKRTNRSLNPP